MRSRAAARPERKVPGDYLNAADYFVDRHVAEGRGHAPALLYQGGEITYRQVAQEVNRVGNALRGLGVAQGERVALLLPDCPEFVYTFFGTVKIGAVAVPLRPTLTPQQLRHILVDSQARVLVTGAETLARTGFAQGDLAHLLQIVVVGASDHFPTFDDITSGCSPDLRAALTRPHDVAFWVYTSGTTSAPRAAVHRQRDMRWSADRLAEPVLGLTAHDRIFSAAPLAIPYALYVALHYSFAMGAALILQRAPLTLADAFDAVHRHAATVLCGSPVFYAGMLQLAHDHPSLALPSCRLTLSSGDVLPTWTCRAWQERFGLPILDGIGSTELGTAPIHSRPDAFRPGSCGQAVPGIQVKIVDEEGRDVPAGEVGTLLVKAASTSPYYWHDPTYTQSKMRGEWFYTGDRFRVDADGYYWYQGRADDMIRIGGTWISPLEVESVVRSHPSVEDCAYVGVRDRAGFQHPIAFVVLQRGNHSGDFMTWQIQRFVWQKIPPATFPLTIVYLDSLPKTTGGKVKRFELRDAEDSDYLVQKAVDARA